MTDDGQTSPEPFHMKADRSIKRAFANVIEQHRQSGLPIAVLRNGQVVHLRPSPLPVEQWEEMDGKPRSETTRS